MSNNTGLIGRGISSSMIGLDEHAYIDMQRQLDSWGNSVTAPISMHRQLSSWENRSVTASVVSNPYQEEESKKLRDLIKLFKIQEQRIQKQDERIFALESKIKFMDI